MRNKLGVVVPCFNELASLPRLFTILKSPSLSTVDFLLVDNGSFDGSDKWFQRQAYPKNIGFVRLEKNLGYGNGVLSGLRLLHNPFIGWTHADLQANPQDLILFLPYLSGHPVFLKGERTGRPILDRFFTGGMSVLVSLLFRSRFTDINGQPTIFSREMFEYWNNPPLDFGLDLFAFISAKRSQAPVIRVAVRFGRRIYGESKWNFGWKSRFKFIRRTIRLAYSLYRGGPSIASSSSRE